MILIISSPDDSSTNDVIDWLRHFDVTFLRISEHTVVRMGQAIVNQEKVDCQIEINGNQIWLSSISSCWYRRSWLTIEKWWLNTSNEELNYGINRQLSEENFYVEDFIEHCLKDRMLNFKDDNRLNKLTALKFAVEVGLSIPESIVTTNKIQAQSFAEKHNYQIISKNFSPGIFAYYQDHSIGTLTTAISKEMIAGLSESFHPVLLQELVNKQFELRIFYLNEEMFCCAIMSQNDELTKLDFRNYNWDKANRTPPFELPFDTQQKLIRLMQKLDLNSGSIDLMVDDNDNLVFLEVNPIGQFGQVSLPGNYQLEKKVAESLISNLHERKN